MRLAGTWSRYSNSAMPQLTRAAMYQTWWLRLLRCPYQANVMKTFEAIRSKVVFAKTGRSTSGSSANERTDELLSLATYSFVATMTSVDLMTAVIFLPGLSFIRSADSRVITETNS